MDRAAAVGAALPQMMPLSTLNEPTRSNVDPKAIGEAFDGIFAQMMIKQMRESLDGGLFGKDAGDVLGGLFDHFISDHIAKSGGFGVGNMIRAQLEMNHEGTHSS
jgi:Rod binding domain-containing protein